MRHTVKLPRLADTVDEVVVLSWICQVGDPVERDAPIMNVETDKTDTDVRSPISGVLVEQLVAEGDEIATGTDIAVVEGE